MKSSENRVGSDLLTMNEVASELGVTARTVMRWHAERIGPPRVKIGRKIYFRAAAVRAWIEAHETAEPRAVA